MQKQQVFKVKGMQRDASMANANGEFAYEILNMRLMPAEDLSGFSLTNEKGTTQVITGINGQVIGQCPTNDSLVVFTTDIVDNEDGTQSKTDYIYEIYQTVDGWDHDTLYSGNLNFDVNKHIEALFNYETEDIQKVYWIDNINQLRCINLVGEIQTDNDQQFDSVKEINSLPSVEIERVIGGSFTAGVIQYYITYFNKNSSESPIVYTSPLLYIAHDNRGANVNDQVSTAFKLTFTDLDTPNWEYMRIYATHRTSIDATPEASIVIELNMNNSTIEFTDYGSNRTSIAPTDLYFTGGKFVKAGTMTVKDQVMFLGNLNIETPETVSVVEIQKFFDSIRDNEDHPFTTTTGKTKENKLEEYEDTHYYYKNQLNNTESITHYKYGEKYRFGISVLDKYGNWSNPIWIKDAFIEIPPEQVDRDTLKLPCPSLNLSSHITYNNENKTLLGHLQDLGAVRIKPLVVFPKEDERKVIAQGVVCPTVYNLKDRKENGPYAQASWFMRPNAPVDLWGIQEYPVNLTVDVLNYNDPSKTQSITINHYSDLIDSNFNANNPLEDNRAYFGYFGAGMSWDSVADNANELKDVPSPIDLMVDDSISSDRSIDSQYNQIHVYTKPSNAPIQRNGYVERSKYTLESVIQHGSWVEFRHNYALRSKGWSFGSIMGGYDNIQSKWQGNMFGFGKEDSNNHVEVTTDNRIFGSFRSAEIGATRYHHMLPVNRLFRNTIDKFLYFRNIGQSGWDVTSNFITGNSAYYVDSSIITLNTPELECSKLFSHIDTEQLDCRIIGIIPITATISDMSIEITNPSPNSEQLNVGPNVIHTTNKNIGHHGFKGVVSANTYFSDPKDPGQDYRTVWLNPWHTAGTIQAVPATSIGFGDSELLKRKILSNLRFSASSFYFHPDTISLEGFNQGEEEHNIARFTNDAAILGWKPANGSTINIWDNSSDTSIIKLIQGKTNVDLVYRGNIDTIATATYGDTLPATIYPAAIGLFKKNDYNSLNVHSHTAWGYESKGASIKYKSSPHFVVAFKEYQKDKLWGNNSKFTQETLPAFSLINSTGLPSYYASSVDFDDVGELYEDSQFGSISHQSQFVISDAANANFIPEHHSHIKRGDKFSPAYGWLWLGEIYRETDPTFGGTSDWALQNNQWETGGESVGPELLLDPSTSKTISDIECYIVDGTGSHQVTPTFTYQNKKLKVNISETNFEYYFVLPSNALSDIANLIFSGEYKTYNTTITLFRSNPNVSEEVPVTFHLMLSSSKEGFLFNCEFTVTNMLGPQGLYIDFVPIDVIPVLPHVLSWTQGDTYYQRFDTLKTYAYSESDQNSVIDITSFMVETRINIDGRTDRNRGQESNLQMSPTNFNLMNDVYSQRDNFFTYRILDEDLQARTNFPNQITWSLTKTAGATVDAWMNITLASVLDLDGTKGKISALKNFNNNIIAFQEKGLSNIMFNSRAQIATSEAVPIQIANTGKVDGQQYFTTDVGCQDKWNIVTTPNGLYFVDYFNKSIYKFNGQLEDISTPNGFRSWCYENLNSTANIIGYYDVKNKEVMYYIGDTRFKLDNYLKPTWLGFSELTSAFSSFYTYPKAWFANVQDQGLWLLSGDNTNVYTHQTGAYNELLNTSEPFYGLTVIPRQDSNTVKTFNNVEFRADSYNGSTLDNNHTFDTISAETEYQPRTTDTLTYSQYRPSSLKKKLRTWRANIPRVNNGYERFVNQWAKIGLWKMDPSTEKTILHDLSVWYSE